MTKTVKFIEMSDGFEVYSVIYQPDRQPIGHVHILHGMAEHIGRYEDFANYLVAKGYVVSGHDHRGHGHTGLKHDQFGFFSERDGFERVTEDVREVMQAIREGQDLPTPILFGHSMGSFIARRYIQKYGHSIAKVVLSGTMGPNGLNEKAGKWLATAFAGVRGKHTGNKILYKLAFGTFDNSFDSVKTGFDWLSTDEREVQRFIHDPLCGFVSTNQFFVDLTDGLNKIHHPKEIARIPKDLPILMVSGSMDPVGGHTKGIWRVAELYKQEGIDNVTVVIREDQRHEVLNEIGKEETYKLIANWMEIT